MDEDEVKAAFGSDYSEPAQDWDQWSRTIEIKLSKQGKIGIAAIAGVVGCLLLIGLQGKVVINLVKQNGLLVTGLNATTDAVSSSMRSTSGLQETGQRASR